MARVNIKILGISQLKWMGVGKFNSDDHYIYYCGQESLRRNGVILIVNKRVRNAILGCSLKNDRMISVHFQDKSFNITVIQVYAPLTNAEEAEVEWFCDDLWNLLEPSTVGDENYKKRRKILTSLRTFFHWISFLAALSPVIPAKRLLPLNLGPTADIQKPYSIKFPYLFLMLHKELWLVSVCT